MNSTSTRPEGRLDELLKDLDESANSRTGEWVCQIWPEDAAYLAAVLRAGCELQKEVDLVCHSEDYHVPLSLHAAANKYDDAVDGQYEEIWGKHEQT